MFRSLDRRLVATAAGALLALGLAGTAQAETGEVRVVQQFGLLYVPIQVVQELGLIQKHAKAMGLKEPEVKMMTISGGANTTKALLANQVDFAAFGVGPLLKLWGKSEGKYKAAFTIADMPLKLITNDPAVKTVDDYLKASDHKIAVPAAKVSIQAVTLQIYAAQKYGDAFKLDHMVVSMKHPTALAALISGGQSVKSHFATLPYSYQELQSGKTHLVLSSYDLMGGPHSVLTMGVGEQFQKDNPKTYAAVVAAYAESFKWIKANPDKAVEIFIKYTKSKLPPKDVKAMLTDPKEISYSDLPSHTKKYADFLAKIGDIPQAKSWKDYHMPNLHSLKGS